jgi:drug/metabolite transporter (DMT)-like permease
MIFLLGTILMNVVNSVIFKLFPKYNINALQAIVVNYWVCVFTGSVFIGNIPVGAATFHQAWVPWAVLTGVAFFSIFNLIAYCTRIDGITTTTVANKLSLVIPAFFSVLLYNDKMGAGKIAGLILAFPAVYFTTRVSEGNKKSQNLLFPILLFLGSGLLDTLVKYIQFNFLHESVVLKDPAAVYTIYSFATAGSFGLMVITVMLLLNKTRLHWRNIVAGICLGIPNYFSIYFLIRMLHSNFLQSSAAIPVNNIGILVASSLVAILFFSEKLTRLRLLGLLLSIGAILLIAYGDKW